MKKHLKHLAAGALLAAAAHPAQAQYAPPPPTQPFPGFLNEYLRKQDPYAAKWDIGGSARVRYELKHDALGLPGNNDFLDTTGPQSENDNDYISTKVLARVALTEKWWSFYVEGRSSLTFGDERSDTGAGPVPGPGGNGGPEQDGPVDLHQAYVTLGNHKEFPISIKAGRQELSYGDERLVGAFAWNNIGRVFDAVKVRGQTTWFAAEAFTSKLVLPDDDDFNTWNEHNLFSGLHLSTKQIPKHTTELYFFARNDDEGSTTANPEAVLPFQVGAPFARNIYTLGARIKSNPGDLGNWDYTAELAYQFGDWKQTSSSDYIDHEALAFVGNVGYSFAESSFKPRVALEYAFASGDDSGADTRHNTFDNLYPTNHKFYGYMDLFAWQNLHDIRAILSLKPHPRVSASLEAHAFWLADTGDSVYNAGGVARGGQGSTADGSGFGRNERYSSYLGSEIDLVVGYALNKFTSLETGYGHFFVGDYIEQTWDTPTRGSTDADWVYVQAVVRF